MKFLHGFVKIDAWISLSVYLYLSKLIFVCDDVRTVVDDEVELGV